MGELSDRFAELMARMAKTDAELFRTIWQQGPAGTEVPLTIARGKSQLHLRVQSRDRGDFLKKPQQH